MTREPEHTHMDSLRTEPDSPRVSHPVLEDNPNANYVRVRIRNSRTQRLHNRASSHIAQINSEKGTLLHQDVQDIYRVINIT
jgi:hypothetical protein